MSADAERMQILQMIEDGKITAAEGLRLLAALGVPLKAGEPAQPAAPTEPAAPAEPPAPAEPLSRVGQHLWMIALVPGVVVFIIGSWLMYLALERYGLGFWFMCAALPALIGLGGIALAWAVRQSRWIHLRIDTASDEGPRHIRISLPLPVKVIAFFIRLFRPIVPKFRETAVDELLLAIDESVTPDSPLTIDVDETSGGERVKLVIG